MNYLLVGFLAILLGLLTIIKPPLFTEPTYQSGCQVYNYDRGATPIKLPEFKANAAKIEDYSGADLAKLTDYKIVRTKVWMQDLNKYLFLNPKSPVIKLENLKVDDQTEYGVFLTSSNGQMSYLESSGNQFVENLSKYKLAFLVKLNGGEPEVVTSRLSNQLGLNPDDPALSPYQFWQVDIYQQSGAPVLPENLFGCKGKDVNFSMNKIIPDQNKASSNKQIQLQGFNIKGEFAWTYEK